jgi:hypothetical protein
LIRGERATVVFFNDNNREGRERKRRENEGKQISNVIIIAEGCGDAISECVPLPRLYVCPPFSFLSESRVTMLEKLDDW